ncbi:MAG: hypothetical protein B6I25_02880 [Planctomycetales bacterium 4572_13]|nr:MAG: hypothetical protein B6I25_02880 [Planctomycetales bacterium 4572_13]
MAIEAPLSSYKKKNMIIMMAILIGLGIWCIYDGYFNESFIQDHLDENGNPKGWLGFNKTAPPYLIGGALVCGVYFLIIKGKKIVADENELVCGKVKVAYDAIEKINKTHFDSKGFFVVTYSQDGQSKELKLSDRIYDNLPAVLDQIVSKIS